MRFRAGLAALACAGVLTALEAAPAAAFQIVPHRALYSMALSASRGSDMADVKGSMMFEWVDSCDGWTVTQRYRMTFLYATGQETELAYNLVSWESKDGLHYRFFMRRTEDGEETKELRGDAQLEEAGGRGKAHFTLPEDKTVALPPGTLFPTAHSMRLLEHAEAGDSFIYLPVFDGNDDPGLFDVSAVILPRPTKTAESSAPASPLLDGGPQWGIALAFYGRDPATPSPEHEQYVNIHDNFVVEELRLDYGKFTVDGTLRKLEKLPPPTC
jgi:hypothetical protein